MKISFYAIFLLFFQCCSENSISPDTKSLPIQLYYPIGSKSQIEWQESKLIMFVHFGMNTFSGLEWGTGNEDPSMFNPESIDTDQWVSTAAEAGIKYIILTAKHHDGFCLWPSKYTDHSIKNSPYKNGEGDVVREFVNSCRKYRVKAGLYLSPWDKHEETYGTAAYNTYFQNQLIELCTLYGEISEFWFDGAKDSSYPSQIYDWELYYSTVKKYQPNSLIAVCGPDIRWIGNENGYGEETEWCIQPRAFNIQTSDRNGRVWFPAECDVSIRPGWFYHQNQDAYVKSADSLIQLYFLTVGRNSNLLLNVPPSKDGLFGHNDLNSLIGFNERLNKIYSKDIFLNQQITASDYREVSDYYSPKQCLDNNKNTFWVTHSNILTAELIITLKGLEDLNIIQLEEEIRYGQRIKAFSIYYDYNGEWSKLLDGTTVGRTRILKFPKINTGRIKISINDSYASPTLRTVSGFYYDFSNSI